MAISRSDISKQLTPNLGNAKRRNSMARKNKTGGAIKKQGGGMTRVGLYPQEERRAGVIPFNRRTEGYKSGDSVPKKKKKSRKGTASSKARRLNIRLAKKDGGSVKKKAGGKIKKYAAGGQGYRDREDESLGMRTGPEAGKTQSMAARRDESYGDWGKRRRGRVNVKKGGSIGVALRGGGAVTR